MFRKIDDFLAVWKGESESTLRVFSALTDASLAQSVSPGGRTLARLCWHLAETLGEMGHKAGLAVEAPEENGAHPANAQSIAAAWKKASASLVSQIGEQWNDAMLEDDLPMYGETWKRGTVLFILITHLAHHRGQITVLMRQAGLKVPGVSGPSKEEWAGMGLPPMA
ncbi:MAG: DinB family protein [Spirochaetes bacterium]|nr:DinB family protein [Spirochaetota bacterium]